MPQQLTTSALLTINTPQVLAFRKTGLHFLSVLPSFLASPPSASSSLLALLEEESMSQEKGRPLPKFGEWDVNDPASAEGFTVIFNKARDERKTGSNSREKNSNGRETAFNNGPYASKPNARKWFCCLAPAES